MDGMNSGYMGMNSRYMGMPTRLRKTPASAKTPTWIIKLEGITDNTGNFKGFEDFTPCRSLFYSAERDMVDESTISPGLATMQNTIEYPLIFSITTRFAPQIAKKFYTGEEIKSAQVQEFTYQSGKAQSLYGVNFENCQVVAFEFSADGNQSELKVHLNFTEHEIFTNALESNGDLKGKMDSYNTTTLDRTNYKKT